MSTKGTTGTRSSFTFDTGLATPNVIAAYSTVNAGNAVLAGADSLQLIGVLIEPSNNVNSTGAVQTSGIASVTAGSNIVAGNTLCSNPVGQAIPFTPSASGTSVRGVLGIAVISASAGNLVDVALSIGSFAENQT